MNKWIPTQEYFAYMVTCIFAITDIENYDLFFSIFAGYALLRICHYLRLKNE